MRRLTVAVMALGCLALVGTLLMPTAPSPISTTVSARVQSECLRSCSFADPGASDKNDHFSFCHVDRSGTPHIICPDSQSIDNPHLSQHFDPNTGVGDFCINTLEDIVRCGGKVPPPPK